MAEVSNPVWFITGCSTGFGRELAKLTLDRGWPTVVTARDKARVADLAQGRDNVLALDLDVTDSGQVHAAAKAAEERFGRIDVLVNNAGYGYQAAIEEGEEDEIRAMFDANVFGLFAMTRAVLPGMRARRSGHIINITSMAGFMGLPGSGYYAATKHAVEGFSDSLRLEVAPLGIKVIGVEPGPFRTDWAGRSLKQTPSRIADYAETAGARMSSTAGYSGKQPGDPVRAGEAMIAATQADEAPRHLVLGAIAYTAVTDKLKERLAQIDRWKETSLSADFPA
ncbi:NADP-dependent 3-hydroxy acid dehydrogenase YdfG [Neorhizobium sp. R1-B]|jgi:NAD(P)-dependent dehydrogenase (short-subunit alcohol dehydrogenase family)|uniref:oxidoreductase n=1 Tax=unclassified Neorhizobium TaxID=2629175 RepID=UPI00104F539B|nr:MULTISPECIES: oxidoreductase [unclassified Neorhizobium]TCV76030.1 NADP-dependent 3-hydroxy acid dehydrogenase YdfG [Neorhizobium sp. S3-V5DH]TDX88981.1 NADP-dependent 3-hydroxy acid dehydrogenase YdfG [Neorhizobium sp. R1-B]